MTVKTRVQIAGIAAASLLIIFNAGEAKADLIGSSVDVTANFPSAMTIFADGGVKVVGFRRGICCWLLCCI